jgi:hypothetical protein
MALAQITSYIPSEEFDGTKKSATRQAVAIDVLGRAHNGASPPTAESAWPDMRKCHALRDRVDDMIRAGFDITGRNPLRLARGRQAYIVENNVIKTG